MCQPAELGVENAIDDALKYHRELVDRCRTAERRVIALASYLNEAREVLEDYCHGETTLTIDIQALLEECKFTKIYGSDPGLKEVDVK